MGYVNSLDYSLKKAMICLYGLYNDSAIGLSHNTVKNEFDIISHVNYFCLNLYNLS